jgi:phage terminase large subunit
MTKKVLKSNYVPQEWQAEIHQNLKRFNVLVVPRQAGKTTLSINELLFQALQCDRRRPQYAYLAPEKAQAKKIAWGNFKDYASFIPDIKFNEAELKITFTNIHGHETTIYIEGADNPDRLRGLYLDGIILDEIAQMPESIWHKVLVPTISTRDGWVIFIGTPSGRNLFYRLYVQATEDDSGIWYSKKWEGSALVESGLSSTYTKEFLATQKDLIDEEAFLQEYETSWDAAVKGAYYGKTLAMLRNNGSIGFYPHNPRVPVITSWDLGSNDATAIWFAQQEDGLIKIIDYYEEQGATIQFHTNNILNKPYKYDYHIFPHDVYQTHWGQGRTRIDQLKDALGGSKIKVLPKLPVIDGINAVRVFLQTCKFNAKMVDKGLDALFLYRSDYKDNVGVFQQVPKHDWTSHAADSFRYLATGMKRFKSDIMFNNEINPKFMQYEDFNPLD